MTLDDLALDAQGLIPAVVQEADTGEVLMVAWMDRQAVEATLSTGLTHFWSRSRAVPWRKGETSGHSQHVQALHVDCDADTLLVQVHQDGVACHTGNRT
ncbi:MAG: phosphoribosyl-AMP cyclohydrolase [Candidatus Rokubacteria bacterium]|nr:phosphoribosyl-AMP cyclohydrolase [Candidatus Rokubacteria bacterium]